jgi:hypothetical protein
VHQITVGGVEVSVLRKAIRHLRLGVYPPSGRVRVAAPLGVSDEAIQRLIVSRLDWIRRHQARFEGQSRQSVLEVITGESPDFLGQPYVLRVVEQSGPARVALQGAASLELFVRPATTVEDRQRVIAAGADDYLAKPFKAGELLEIIRRLTGAEYLLDEDDGTVTGPVAGTSEMLREAVASLPSDLVSSLREATTSADIDLVNSILDRVAEVNPSAAQMVRVMVANYRYEELLDLLS